MTNIFVEKSYTKCAGETIISLDQYVKVLNSLFLLYANLKAMEIVKSGYRSLAFT